MSRKLGTYQRIILSSFGRTQCLFTDGFGAVNELHFSVTDVSCRAEACVIGSAEARGGFQTLGQTGHVFVHEAGQLADAFLVEVGQTVFEGGRTVAQFCDAFDEGRQVLLQGGCTLCYG